MYDGSKFGEVEVVKIFTVAEIDAYLAAASGGCSDDNPIPLPIAANLANDWTNILGKTASAGRYVKPDLSACTMSGTEYDPGTANMGKSKIVSLVLPNTAKSIKPGGEMSSFESSFKDFTALTSISSSAVETVGSFAFFGRDTLTTVDFQKAMSIGENAFSSCDALTTVNLPVVTSIGNFAFVNCDALTTVNLPKAQTLGERVLSGCDALTMASLPEATSIHNHSFSGCTALTTVNFPEATSFGDFVFGNTGGIALTVILGSAVPTLGKNTFNEVTTAKPATVKVPSGATGYESSACRHHHCLLG
ncbi:MAG: leucine-rich repeat domain-containing protein [Spirochaetaceae bacterium]|jgi:hypothetical protein|nr:leucine-rich repeat domain-containing protein [Spirochaetaceae bacterium]